MNRKAVVGLVTLVVLLLLAAWNWGWSEREEPLVAEIREIAEQPQSPERDRALRDTMRQQMQGVPEDQRMQFFEKLAPVFVPMMAARFEAEYDKFMDMTPEERNRELDKRIDSMAKRGGGPGGNRPNMDPKKAAEMQKKMLAWTTPSQRAKFDNGFQLFAARMKERGMTPPPMPGGGFF